MGQIANATGREAKHRSPCPSFPLSCSFVFSRGQIPNPPARLKAFCRSSFSIILRPKTPSPFPLFSPVQYPASSSQIKADPGKSKQIKVTREKIFRAFPSFCHSSISYISRFSRAKNSSLFPPFAPVQNQVVVRQNKLQQDRTSQNKVCRGKKISHTTSLSCCSQLAPKGKLPRGKYF